MTGWLGLVFSALFLAAVWLIWRASDRSRPMTSLVVVLGVLIAPALVWTSLIDASLNGRFGDMHLSLTRLTVDVTRGALSIGGGPDDDLFIRGASPAVVTVPRQTPGAGPVLMEVSTKPASETLSVAAVRHGNVYDYIGAQDLSPGMAVCLTGCEAIDAVWYRFERAPWRFERLDGAAGPTLPQRRAFGLAPTVSWKPSQAIHPLDRVLPGAPRTPGFVYQTGKLFGGWKILLPDPGARLGKVEGGRVTPLAAPAPGPVPVDTARALSIWDVRTYNAADPGDPLGRLQERREIALSQTGTVLTATLSTPAVERVGRCPRNGSPSPVAPDFPVLGGDLSNALTQDLPYPEPGHCAELASGTFRLTDPVALGKSAELRLDRLGGPWLLGWLSLAWAVVVLAVWGDDWRSDAASGGRRLQWMLFVALQALLAMRMLIAFAGLAADPELAGGLSVVGEAGLAYLAMTGLLLLLGPPTERRALRMALVFGFVVAVTLALHLWMTAVPGPIFLASFKPAFWTPTPGGLALVATVAVLVVSGLHALAQSEGQTTLIHTIRSRIEAIVSARFVGPVSDWRTVLPVTGFIRLLLGLASIKERLPVLGFAVSALYTPALILGFSGLMADGARSSGKRRLALGLVFCASLAILFVALPVGVKDNGYAIVGVAVLVMAAWGVWERRRQATTGPERLAALAWAAPLIGAVLVILIASLLFQAPAAASRDDIARAAVAASDQPALDILARAGAYSQNQLRLWAFGSPDQVERYGSWEAENLRVWSQHLSDYTATLFGHGYLAPVNLSVLKPVQLNDNVSTIHVMAPYGRFGAAALLLCLAVLAAAAARVTRSEGDGPPSQGRLIGLMSLWILFGVGAYVVLANLQLAPFTGRNVYLLAAASDSDLLEGMTLFVMAWLGLTWVPRTRLEDEIV
ncbi:MAG TPA: hypothetical protein VF633_06995 [Brevundimonas sp.]|jgi:hypothetical protein